MNRYEVKCFNCATKFDASTAAWCDCDRATATWVCANCGSCFCSAPIPYKRSVLEGAPRALRESRQRFGRQLVQLPPRDLREGRAPAVLVIDDDEAMRSFMVCLVEHLGYRTLVSSDPFEALSFAAGDYIDVVITDALMPKMDGRELCRRIKEGPNGKSKKVIVMTSLYKGRRFRNEAMSQFGADEFLHKPIDFALLADALARLAPLEEREAM